MAHFSNGTEGLMYQEKWCYGCHHWREATGCPIWFLHELHVGEHDWQPALDRMIPMVPKTIKGIAYTFAGECSAYWDKTITP